MSTHPFSISSIAGDIHYIPMVVVAAGTPHNPPSVQWKFNLAVKSHTIYTSNSSTNGALSTKMVVCWNISVFFSLFMWALFETLCQQFTLLG